MKLFVVWFLIFTALTGAMAFAFGFALGLGVPPKYVAAPFIVTLAWLGASSFFQSLNIR